MVKVQMPSQMATVIQVSTNLVNQMALANTSGRMEAFTMVNSRMV